VPRDTEYLDFQASIVAKGDLKALIETDHGVRTAEAAVTTNIEQWWKTEASRFDALKSVADLVDLRKQLLSSFEAALRPAGLLDRFAVSGTVASWWGASLPDFKTLATLGYKGLVTAWVATVLDALNEEKAKIDPLDHKAARALLPEYLDGLAALEAEVAELDATIKAATATDDEEDSAESDDELLSSAELKHLKAKLTAAKKQLKAQKASFAQHLTAASNTLTDVAARELVLDTLNRDILAEAADRVVRQRRLVLTAFETWWDKYRTPLSAIEADRDVAAAKLAGFLEELGYE
jgi:type I restriction enzyme M protein